MSAAAVCLLAVAGMAWAKDAALRSVERRIDRRHRDVFGTGAAL